MTSSVHTTAPRMGSDAISSWPENPLFHVTRTCIGFLQGLFEQAPVGCFHWVDDQEQTELVITDDLPIDIGVVNQRPAIITVRSPVAFGRVSLDQMMETDIKTGGRVHSDLVSGHMTFNCLSRNKVEAEQLGWLVGRHLWILRRMFLKSGFNDFGQGVQIAASSPAGAIVQGSGDTEILSVAVTTPFRFQWTERITPLNQNVVQSIQARMQLNAPTPLRVTEVAEGGSTGPGLRGTAVGANFANQINSMRSGRSRIRPPSIRGRTIQTSDHSSGQPAADPQVVEVNT